MSVGQNLWLHARLMWHSDHFKSQKYSVVWSCHERNTGCKCVSLSFLNYYNPDPEALKVSLTAFFLFSVSVHIKTQVTHLILMMCNQCKMCTLCSPILLGVGTRKERLSEEIKWFWLLVRERIQITVDVSLPSVDVLCGLQRKPVGVGDLKASFNVYNWWIAGVSRARMWCLAYFFL